MSTKSKTRSRTRSKNVSKSNPRSRTKLKLKSRSRSKTKKVEKRSRSPLNKGKKVDNLFFTGIKPICSMRVQFFSDIHNRIPYSPHNFSQIIDKKSKHFGQRKLLLTELYFLAEYAHLSNLIVYIGAADGFHIPILCDFFPKHVFHLYDDRKFFIPQKYMDSGQVVIYPEYFTNLHVEKYKYQNILFVSDIRDKNTEESNIMRDMELQKSWVLNIKPIKSLLKFRLPFNDGAFCSNQLTTSSHCYQDYLNGKLLLQPWAPISSTEMRLIVDQNPTIKKYDCIEVEDKMFYHNLVVRNKPILFQNKSYTWDFMQECAIIRYFKMKYPKFVHLNITSIINAKVYGDKTLLEKENK